MPKKTATSNMAGKKLGRRESIQPEDLSRRYRDLKYFLESQWGRIGWELRYVRRSDEVREILKLVPRVESWTPFQDRQPAACMLEEGEIEIEKRELDLLRQQQKDADNNERRFYSQYHTAYAQAESATVALMSTISQFGTAPLLPPLFWVIFLTARELRVEKLTNETEQLRDLLNRAKETNRDLKRLLISRSGWFARNEIVKFRKSNRVESTAINFAKAMSGMPEYSWLHSLRKCSKIQGKFDKATSYVLFEILEMLVKKSKPVDLGKLGVKLREELLKPGTDLFVRGYAGKNWGYLKWAFADCTGKGHSRARLPYRIMGRLLYHLERPKSITEIELAKLEEWA
jgi:hypothetical protein